jgi:Cu/Ag efflux protein CusF
MLIRKNYLMHFLAASLTFFTAGALAAETFTKGTVKKMNTGAGKVTIIHEEIVDLEMPPMTMVFRANEEIISQLAPGQDVYFLVKRVNGKLTIVDLKFER